jgi:CubicO group peptidase (beta-lactamase class C family)
MTQYSLRRLIVGTVVLTSTCLAAPEQKPGAIGERMREFVDKKEIAGAVVLVATRNGVAHVETVGQADIEKNMPMSTDTIFWIASMTKPVTATAVMMLQDEGKLSVEDPVAKYVPELAGLKTQDGQPANLTLRHLLTHTSGMGEATPQESKTAKTLADLVPAFASKPVQFKPGSKWQYCQSGINTLGRIVEVVSGKDLESFYQERLFRPLGMKDTTFYPTKEQAARIATSYRRTGDKLEPTGVFVLEGKDVTSRDRYPAANGGLYSTAHDYARFCRMVLNNGSLDGKKYLSPEAVKQMTSVQTPESIVTGFTPGNGWGLGWCVVRQPQGISAVLSPGTFGHGGAYGTQAWIDPVKGVAYILMTQRANFPNSDASDVRKAFQEAAAMRR